MGLGLTKPKHFRDMLGILWENRDNLPYAWKVLSRGVCDGCALGVAGLHDWTIQPKFPGDPTGIHLCMTRLNLIRLNTMPAFAEDTLADVSRLEQLNNAQLRRLGRLPFPYLREKGAPGFRRVSWNEAYRRIAGQINASTPERLAFFVTARGVTNEVYYVAQKVARFLGTNNVDNAARICHSPSTTAMKHAIGHAATTCSYNDWYGTDLVVFFGSNPANDQPVSTKYLHEAKKRGTRVVMVNPYLEPGMQRYWVPSNIGSSIWGTDIADYWFPVTQGGDIAFLCGVMRILVENNWLDREFIQQHTADFNDLREHLLALDWCDLEHGAGLPRASMLEFAELVRDSPNAVLVWSMGITQHAYGADAVSMILNLGLSQGWVGRDKCGLMPIRGHSSVQGGAEMGAYATAFPGGKAITPETAAELTRDYGFDVPSTTGFTTTQMIEAAAAGELDLLYALGGNFLRNLPDPEHIRTALGRPSLRVHQDIVLTDQMLVPSTGDVILLPAKTRYEQDGGGIETTTERRVAFTPEIPRQVGEAKAEWRILLELARTADPERADRLGCESGDAIRTEIARIVPLYDGIQNLRKTGDAIQYGGPHLCANGDFPTPDGKARFKTVLLPAAPVHGDCGTPAEERRFVVSTRRGKQFNSLIYAEVDPINGAPRDAVLINEDDARELGLKNGAPVRLTNARGDYLGRAFHARIAPGNLQIHWPEGNILIPGGVEDAGGGVPDYNALVTLQTGSANIS